MTVGSYRHAGETGNDAVAARLSAAKRRRIWKLVIVSNAIAIVATIAGCLFMMRTQGVKSDVEQMRNEVGETMTMMSLGGASEAVARYIPNLIGTTVRWERKFAGRREGFRGLDAEINQVQDMHRLGVTAERWRKELEGISPMQRNELWQKSLKAQVEAEQKKWPNRTHERGVSEWLVELGKEFWFGMRHGLFWPCSVYDSIAKLARGKYDVDRLGVGGCLRIIFFPYKLSYFTILRLTGITIAVSGIGYLMCWIGLKSRFGWLSYLGLFYFLYLINVAIFILWLEVTT